MKNNRLPAYFLGFLVLVAIVWRIANPPAPKPVGPMGMFPGWKSRSTRGNMVAQAVSPSGKMWAGAWNEDKAGKKRSAVWIIDFEKFSAKMAEQKSGDTIQKLFWNGDGLVSIVTQKAFNTTNVETGKRVSIKLPKGQMGDLSPEFDTISSPNSSFMLVSKSDNGNKAFYLDDSKNPFTPLFTLKDLPGRVEGAWVTDTGNVLVASIANDKAYLLTRVNKPDAKLEKLKAGAGKKWTDAPKAIRWVAYNGGYELNISTGKVKKLFAYSKADRDYNWLQAIEDGRLYPLKNGNWISVSLVGDEIDIRELKSNGEYYRDLLARY